MPSWKDRFSGTGRKIVHEVEGKRRDFYVIRGSVALRLRPLAKPLGRILAHMTERQDHDYAVQQKHHESPTPAGTETFSETIMEPKPLEVIQFRSKQLNGVVDEVVALLMADENQQLLVDIIASSMRTDFAGEHPTADEFFEEFDVDTIKEMLVGVAKANMKLFGPFQQAMEAFSSRAIARAKAAAEPVDDVDETPAPDAQKDQIHG